MCASNASLCEQEGDTKVVKVSETNRETMLLRYGRTAKPVLSAGRQDESSSRKR